MKPRLKTQMATGLCLVVLGIVMVWGNTYVGSRGAYERAVSFEQAGDMVKAVTFFDRSIRWYAPLNPYVHRSAQRIWDLGEAAEKQGDDRLALMAFRTIRQGFHAIGSFFTPGKAWIEKCDKKIGAITNPRLGPLSRPPKDRELAPFVQSAAQGLPGPHRGWSLLVVASFLGWVISVLGLIRYGIDGHERAVIVWRPAVVLLLSAGVFFTLWIMSMMKA